MSFQIKLYSSENLGTKAMRVCPQSSILYIRTSYVVQHLVHVQVAAAVSIPGREHIVHLAQVQVYAIVLEAFQSTGQTSQIVAIRRYVGRGCVINM